MSSIRTLKYFIVGAAVASMATFGCSKKDEKKADGTAQTGEVKGAEGATKPAETARSPYAFLPADSNVVVGINGEQIRSSKLFKDMVEPIIQKQAGADYEKVKTACGFDPISEVQSVLVGGVAGKEDKMVFSVKGLDADQVKKCGEGAAQVDGEKVEITQEGNVTKVVSKGETNWLAWLDKETMVTAAGSTGKDKAAVEALVTSKEGLDKNQEMMALMGKVDTSAALWVVFVNTDASSPLQGAPVQAKAVYASIKLSDGLSIDAGLRQNSPEEAQKTVADFTAKLEEFKQSPYAKYVSKLELKAQESDVVAKLVMSDAELQELLKDPNVQMLGNMMGM